MTLLADQPELVALANLASVAPSKVAAAFNDEPEQFFVHLSLDELQRLQGAAERLAALSGELAMVTAAFAERAREALGQTDAD